MKKMKNVAILVVVVILSGIIIQPVTEYGFLLREKIELERTLGNAVHVAHAESLVYLDMRDLNAVVDESEFMSVFIDAFEAGLNLTHVSTNGYELKFSSLDDIRNDITVIFDFDQEVDLLTNKTTSTVEVTATTLYKLKSTYLVDADTLGEDLDYEIVGRKTKILNIEN